MLHGVEVGWGAPDLLETLEVDDEDRWGCGDEVAFVCASHDYAFGAGDGGCVVNIRISGSISSSDGGR